MTGAVLRNSFWLVVPVLLFNLVFAGALPPAFQGDVFWHDIPPALSVPENVLRVLVLGLPALTPWGPATPLRTRGLALYAFGVLVYVASWTALIVRPDGAWSTTAVGFMAPAWTPVFWLGGIALVGDERLFIPLRFYRRWMFAVAAAAFLLFHNAHAALVFSRLP